MIEHDLRRFALDNGADCQLFLPGQAELADDDDVKLSFQSHRDLERHRDSTARQRKDEGCRLASLGKDLGEPLAGFLAIVEQWRHGNPPPSGRTAELAPGSWSALAWRALAAAVGRPQTAGSEMPRLAGAVAER